MGTSAKTTETSSDRKALTLIAAGLLVGNAMLFLLLLWEQLAGTLG